MTKQDLIDLEDAELIDLGEASEKTEGFPGPDSEDPGNSSSQP